MKQRPLKLAAILAGAFVVTACSGTNPTSLPIPTSPQQLRTNDTISHARPSAGRKRKANVTQAATVSTISLSSIPGPYYAITVAPYLTHTSDLWFTSSQGVSVYDVQANTLNYFALDTAHGYPRGINELPANNWLYVTMTGPYVLEIDPFTNPPTAAYLPSVYPNVGGVTDDNNYTVWSTYNGGFNFFNTNTDQYGAAPSSLACASDSLHYYYLGTDLSLECPIDGTKIGVYDTVSHGTTQYTLPAGPKPDQKVVQVDYGTAGNWATQVRYGSGNPALAIFQLDNNGNIIDSITGLGANTDEGALTARSGIWAIGNDIQYMGYCGPNPPLFQGGYGNVPVSFGHDPKTMAGGLTSPNDKTAWFLDNNKNQLVHVPVPSFECPYSATTAVKSVIRTLRPKQRFRSSLRIIDKKIKIR